MGGTGGRTATGAGILAAIIRHALPMLVRMVMAGGGGLLHALLFVAIGLGDHVVMLMGRYRHRLVAVVILMRRCRRKAEQGQDQCHSTRLQQPCPE